MQAVIANLMRQLSHGVYVVGVRDAESVNAFTASWVTQLSFDPLLVGVSIHPQHRSWKILQAGQVFSINVLSQDQLAIAAHFGVSSHDKLGAIAWQPGEKTQVPVLDSCCAFLECRVTCEVPAGDHRLVMGQVVNGSVSNSAGEPLLYQHTGEMDGSLALFPQQFSAD